MLSLLDRRIGSVRWRVAVSERTDGDLHPERVDPHVLDRRQRALTGHRWVMTDQVHGTAVADIGPAPPWPVAATADVVVADAAVHQVAIWTADCAPVFLLEPDGRVVAFHAGWRGLAAGIVDVAVDRVRADVADVIALVGPTIGPCCYQFGAADAARVAAGVGVEPRLVVRTDESGDRVRLDVPSAVRHALDRRGLAVVDAAACTSCGGDWFSHRRRADPRRHATVAWADPA